MCYVFYKKDSVKMQELKEKKQNHQIYILGYFYLKICYALQFI